MSILEVLEEGFISMKKNYGKLLITSLAFLLVVIGLGIISGLLVNVKLIGLLILLAYYIIVMPLTFGFTKNLIDMYKGEEIGAFDFWNKGLKNFKISWKVSLRLLLKYIVPIIIYIISTIMYIRGTMALFTAGNTGLMLIGTIGYIVASILTFILSLKYSFTLYELAYDTQRKSKDVINDTAENMNGNKLRYFGLLVIIGLMAYIISLLVQINMFVAIIMLIFEVFAFLPYVQFVFMVFYDSIRQKEKIIDCVEENEDSTHVESL